MESNYKKYKDQGFHLLVLLGEGAFGVDPMVEDLQEWASAEGGASFRVLADPAWGYVTEVWGGKQVGMSKLIAPGVKVVVSPAAGIEEAFEAIPEYLP